jgi:hypothetical protein
MIMRINSDGVTEWNEHEAVRAIRQLRPDIRLRNNSYSTSFTAGLIVSTIEICGKDWLIDALASQYPKVIWSDAGWGIEARTAPGKEVYIRLRGRLVPANFIVGDYSIQNLDADVAEPCYQALCERARITPDEWAPNLVAAVGDLPGSPGVRISDEAKKAFARAGRYFGAERLRA